MQQDIIKFALALLFVLLAVASDYKQYKIKNSNCLIFSLIGIILNFATGGTTALIDSAYGMLIPLVLLPLFAVRMLGAGDIKALCAIGSIVGKEMSIYTTMLSFLVGGVIALFFMIFRENAGYRFRQLWLYFKQCFYLRKLQSYEQFTNEKSGFRFSLGILGGFILAVVWIYIYNQSNIGLP